MSFRGYILTALALVFAGALVARAVENGASAYQPPIEKNEPPKEPAKEPAAKKTPVDFMAVKADNDRELNRRLGLEDAAVVMTGNVVFHHNGAVISCDSAIQHSARHIEWLGNVIVNKDSTFIYADRADYNGETNLAKLFSPVIKVVDGGSTLYTCNFEFNTLDDIGRWWGGGVIYQDKNTIQSERGYYFSALREMVAVENVEMKNDSHQLAGDSVRYNSATRVATFYTPTTIWTTAGEIIAARRGSYNTADSAYLFHDHAYVMTPTREVWADTIDYNATTGHALLLGNAQAVDGGGSEGSVSAAWGDWLEYWDKPFLDTLTGVRRAAGEAMLTRRPAIANFDAAAGSDTLYMRADTFFMAVARPHRTRPTQNDSLASGDPPPADSTAAPNQAPQNDSLPAADTLPQVQPDKKALAREAKAAARAEKRARKLVAKAARRAAKRARRGLVPLFDSLASRRDSVLRADSLFRVDSIAQRHILDSLQAVGTAAPRQADAEPDSITRTFTGWHNVRMWRPDFAAVADSLIGFSADSTVHLYKDPLLWHGDNQIDSDSITIWSANRQISRAEFYGGPIMAMQVDDERFNQVKGRVMVSHFRAGELYRHDAVGNAEAVYYMQEDPPADTTVVFDPSPIAFVALTATEISFLIDSQTVRYIVSREGVRAPVYPMDQIPMSEPQRLQGFRWYADRRPSLADVFAREWRPSRRAEMDTLPRPLFPIVDRIDRRKTYLMMNRMWVDRSEPLPAHAIEFREEHRSR